MSTKTPIYLLTLLLLFSLTSLLVTASALPAKDSDTTTKESELVSINGKIIPLSIPIYQRSEDGTFKLIDDAESNGRLECQTSSASPYVWDISDAANKVRHSGNMCFQNNQHGSKCTRYANHGTAALAVCGSVWLGAKCSSLAWVADRIIEHCRSGNQAGGQYYYDSTNGWLKAIVYRD